MHSETNSNKYNQFGFGLFFRNTRSTDTCPMQIIVMAVPIDFTNRLECSFDDRKWLMGGLITACSAAVHSLPTIWHSVVRSVTSFTYPATAKVKSPKTAIDPLKNVTLVAVSNLLYVYRGSAKEGTLGCVIHASWPPLDAGARFTQPRVHFLADPCSNLANLYRSVVCLYKPRV